MLHTVHWDLPLAPGIASKPVAVIFAALVGLAHRLSSRVSFRHSFGPGHRLGVHLFSHFACHAALACENGFAICLLIHGDVFVSQDPVDICLCTGFAIRPHTLVNSPVYWLMLKAKEKG